VKVKIYIYGPDIIERLIDLAADENPQILHLSQYLVHTAGKCGVREARRERRNITHVDLQVVSAAVQKRHVLHHPPGGPIYILCESLEVLSSTLLYLRQPIPHICDSIPHLRGIQTVLTHLSDLLFGHERRIYNNGYRIPLNRCGGVRRLKIHPKLTLREGVIPILLFLL
jgi:hypothetical protein